MAWVTGLWAEFDNDASPKHTKSVLMWIEAFGRVGCSGTVAGQDMSWESSVDKEDGNCRFLNRNHATRWLYLGWFWGEVRQEGISGDQDFCCFLDFLVTDPTLVLVTHAHCWPFPKTLHSASSEAKLGCLIALSHYFGRGPRSKLDDTGWNASFCEYLMNKVVGVVSGGRGRFPDNDIAYKAGR